MLTIQFGQCGNQVGQALFSAIASDLYSSKTGVTSKRNCEYVQNGFDKWFKGVSKSGKHLARAVLIDTEQKVINKICCDEKNASSWSYSAQNIVCDSGGGGSANNWGYGYSSKGSRLVEPAIEAVRREIERMDTIEGILTILSSAGGTGSGVGSRVVETLREEFNAKTIASCVILPYSSGEVCTQNYNTLLTLAKFVDISDIVLIFENEQIHAICETLMKIPNANLNDLNRLIGWKLATILQPVTSTSNLLSSLVYQITPHPQYKIASVKTSPIITSSPLLCENGYKWLPIVRHFKQMLRNPTMDLELVDSETRMPSNSISSRTNFSYAKSVANVLFTRGSDCDDDQIIVEELKDEKLYVEWAPESQRFKHFNQKRKFHGKDKFAALVTNNYSLHRPINAVVEKAWNGYVNSAFLHQYKKHGVSEDDFLKAFAKIENVVKVYKELNNEAID